MDIPSYMRISPSLYERMQRSSTHSSIWEPRNNKLIKNIKKKGKKNKTNKKIKDGEKGKAFKKPMTKKHKIGKPASSDIFDVLSKIERELSEIKNIVTVKSKKKKQTIKKNEKSEILALLSKLQNRNDSNFEKIFTILNKNEHQNQLNITKNISQDHHEWKVKDTECLKNILKHFSPIENGVKSNSNGNREEQISISKREKYFCDYVYN